MPHHVFISHSSEDKLTADAVCAGLEAHGIPCWIAPRDIVPGEDFPSAIARAIKSSRVMVLIYSSNIFTSEYVKSELEIAFKNNVLIAPFRIEKIEPEEAFELYLSRPHWLEAVTPPLQAHIEELAKSVCQTLGLPYSEIQLPPLPLGTASTTPLRPPAQTQKPVPAPSTRAGWVKSSSFKWIAGIAIVAVLALLVYFFLKNNPLSPKPTLEAGSAIATTLAPTDAVALLPSAESVLAEEPTQAPILGSALDAAASDAAASNAIEPVPQSDVPSAPAPAAAWQPITAIPRFINDFAADPANPSVLYAASGNYADSGTGIYKSQDAGLTWQPVSADLPDQAVHSLAINRSAPSTLFAAVDYDLYASPDGGASWSLRGSPAITPGFEALHLLVTADGQTLFAVGGGDGLMRSQDGGASWLPLSQGLPLERPGQARVLSLAIDPQDESILYAGTGGFVGQGQGVYKSLDGGESWSPANQGMLDYRITALAVSPSDSQVILAGGDSGNLFKSSDAGASWVDLTAALQLTQYSNPRQMREIVFNPQSPQEITLLADNSGVLVSSDGGESWKPFPQPAEWEQPMFSAFAVIFDLQETPGSQPILFTATSSGIDGKAWRYGTASDTPQSSVQETAPQQTAQPTAVVQISGRWQVVNQLPRSINSFAIDPANPQTVLACSSGSGLDGALFKSADGGASWSALPEPDPEDDLTALAFSYPVPSTLYAVTANQGLVFSSQDGGQTFTPGGETGIGMAMARQLIPSPGSASTLFSIADGNGLARSNDGGYSWLPLQNGLPQDDYYVFVMSLAVDPLDTSRLFAGTGGFVGSGHGVYKSSDGGESWSPANQGMFDHSITALAVDPLNPQVIYAGSDFGSLFKSSDGAQTWTDLTSNLQANTPNAPRQIRSILIDPANPQLIYLLADNSGVLYSTDAGQTWKPLAQPSDWDQPMFSAFAVIFGPQPILLVSLADGATFRYAN